MSELIGQRQCVKCGQRTTNFGYCQPCNNQMDTENGNTYCIDCGAVSALLQCKNCQRLANLEPKRVSPMAKVPPMQVEVEYLASRDASRLQLALLCAILAVLTMTFALQLATGTK